MRPQLRAIIAGEGDIFLAAGVETVSRFINGMADDGCGECSPGATQSCYTALAGTLAGCATAPKPHAPVPQHRLQRAMANIGPASASLVSGHLAITAIGGVVLAASAAGLALTGLCDELFAYFDLATTH